MIAAPMAARFARDLAALAPDGRLALAVSGGPDSLALLLLAQRARPGAVVAATVDHRLRVDAGREARAVGVIARGLGVPHAILTVTVTPAGAGLQAAARAARYAALDGWARAAGAAWLLTAHHADDQAETLLMRLARGAGLAGLAGVRRARATGGVPLVRPLLGWRKAELVELVRAAGLQAADDPANRDPRHDRTAIRALLAREPGLPVPRLARAAAHLADADDALAWMTMRLWAERATGDDAARTIDLAGLPIEAQRRLLARALPGARGGAVAALLRRLRTAPAATLAGWIIRREGERLLIALAPPHRNLGPQTGAGKA